MRNITKLGAVLMAAVTLPVIPTRSAPGNGADTQWVFSSYYVDSPGVFFPCTGETMHFFGEVPYKRHTVTTPSGGTSYKYQEAPGNPNLSPFLLVGEVSGKVYQFKYGLPYNESYHLAAGETLNGQTRATYVADDGDRIIATYNFHLTANANGELVVDRVYFSGFECIDR